MAHAPTPPIAPRTGLWGLGFQFEIIAGRFASMYEETKAVWLIGKWLSWPFYFLSIYFYSTRDKSWEADSALVNAITWINGIVEGSTLIDLLETLWWEFNYLRTDPIGWVRLKIDQVSGELQFIRQDPYGWISSRLYAALPVFYTLLGNSGWWIYNELDKRYPDTGEFIRDGYGYIRNKVLNIFYWASDLDRDPAQAVVDWLNVRTGWFWEFTQDASSFIYDRMKAYDYSFNLLLTDPIRWVKEKMSSIMGMSYAEIDNFIPSIITRIFSAILGNQGGLLDYTRDAVCNIILRFI